MASAERGRSHPGATELERFLLGDLDPRRAAPVIAHLLRGCEHCRQQMTPLASVMFIAGPTMPEPSQDVGSEYDFPLFKAFAAARRHAAARTPAFERQSPLLQDLQEASHLELDVSALPSDAEIRFPIERCETLLEQCRALRHSDPEGMVLAASLAVKLTERMDERDGSPAKLADLQAKAWSELGNAYRVSDHLSAAESALAQALRKSEHGSGDPLLLARLMDLTASLYIDQRRFDEAHRLLDAVYAIYSREGDTQAAARILVSRGMSAGYALQTDEAIHFLGESIRQIDSEQDPKLALAAVHNLLWCLVDSDRIDEAFRLLKEARGLYTVHGERLEELKAHWLEARIAAGMGQDKNAERAFLEVRQGFDEAELFYDSALVSLHLADLWLRQGRTGEIKALIDEMITVFRARSIRREALGALLLLQKAFQRDSVTASLLRAITFDLWRMERFPARQPSPLA